MELWKILGDVAAAFLILISKPSPNCTVYIKGESMVLKAVRHKIKKGMVMY